MAENDDQTKLAFFSKFNQAFDSPTHSDLTVVVNTTRFHVHKVILGLRTSFFTNATKNGFSEALDNVVTIREHSIEAVRAFLKYCYTGDYSDSDVIHGTASGCNTALNHLHVYALADMLDVLDLKVLATKKLQTQLEMEWSNLAEILKEAYSITNPRDKEIRDVLVASAMKHLDELLKKEDFTGALNEVAEFSGTLVIAMKAAPAIQPQPAHSIQVCSNNVRCTNCLKNLRFYCNRCGFAT
ncbi:POZ domain-containing protein [Wilcoxina mikolae CBS 423.85]|nr:POZ domain-containing protein [Wilcoxina mikolae CBS 423.85]